MGKSFKYAYKVKQTGSVHMDLFGRNTKLTAEQLEHCRSTWNAQHGSNIAELALVNHKTGVQVASSVDFRRVDPNWPHRT